MIDVASLSDVGTARERNEDRCAHLALGDAAIMVAVADGVSGGNGPGVASETAIEALVRTYRELPDKLAIGKRLHRAAQRANIEVFDLAVVVTELSGMATTLTAVVIDGGDLYAVHIGDTRLYRVRGGRIVQLTKDHTTSSDRSVLTRSLGRELIAQFDQLSAPVEQGDTLLVCSDGLYNALGDGVMLEVLSERDAATSCAALIEAANARGTADNLTAAVVRLTDPIVRAPRPGLFARLRGVR